MAKEVLLCSFKICVAGVALKIFFLQKPATQLVTHKTILLKLKVFIVSASHIAVDTFFGD